MIAYRLYLGRKIGKVDHVSDSLFDDFLTYSVDSRFPGYTVIHAEGVWKGEPEDTTILEIIADGNRAEAVRRIASVYRDRFEQEAVLMTQSILEGEFV